MAAHIDLSLDRFEVHWLLDNFIVVLDLFSIDRFTEWPRILMLEQHLENFVALLFESAFICLFLFQVGLVIPTGFFQPRDFIK